MREPPLVQNGGALPLQGAHAYGDSGTWRRTVFVWLTRYNTRRRHSANGHLSPDEYEHRHHAAKLTLAA